MKSLKENSLFSRKTSGFVKGFNFRDVFIFNILGYATGLSLATNPIILGGLYPLANIYWTLIFGIIISIFTGILYGYFSTIFPRSGGDYIYNSRIISPLIGFVASWGFTWSQIYGIGTFSGWAIKDAISPAFITTGFILDKSNLIKIGNDLSSNNYIFLGGIIILIICFVMSIINQSVLKKILNSLFVIAMISVLLMIASFWTVDHSTFIERFNEIMYKSTGVSNSYHYILDLAQKNGLTLNNHTTIIDSFYALPIGFLIFFGFTYSVYIGGEVRNPQKTQRWGIILALAFGFIISIIGMGRYYEVVGYDLNNAISIVSSLKNNPLPTSGSMVFMSGILLKNSILSIIMTFGSVLWFIMLPIVMTIICIRNIFAYSIDRILPISLSSRLNNRPVVASGSIILSAFIVLILMTYYDFPYINYITLFSVCYLITGISGFILVLKKSTQNYYINAPEFIKKKIFHIPLITLSGIITALAFLFIVFSSLTNNNFSGVKAGYIPLIVLVIIYGVGFLIFHYRNKNIIKKGIDPELLFNKLPPE